MYKNIYNNKEFVIFSGNSNNELSYKISRILNINLGNLLISRFSDGEIQVEIKENVRSKDVFILQSICYPSNDNFMELMIISDALKRASVRNIIAIIPYFGYARQDRKFKLLRTAISFKIVANMLELIGINKIVTIDLHSDQTQGFFNIPIDNISALSILTHDLKKKYKEVVVVSPDIGGLSRARLLAKYLNCDFAIIDKRRPKANFVEIISIIGNVSKKNCIIIDDIVDTANTLCKTAKILKDYSASRVFAYVTHPVLSGNSIEKINESSLDKLIVTDTIPINNNFKYCKKIRVLTCSYLLSEIFFRIYYGNSILSLFKKIY